MKYTVADMEGAPRQPSERAGTEEEPTPMKISQDVSSPTKNAPKSTSIWRKTVDSREGGHTWYETLKKRECSWREGARGGSIRGARENCYCGAGKAAPRHRDLTWRQLGNADYISRRRPVCPQKGACH